jgi:hypothetical protein
VSWQAVFIVQSLLAPFILFFLRELGLFVYNVQFYKVFIFLPAVTVSLSEVIRIFFF